MSSATVELAAAALSVAPARIAKTLSFSTPQGPLLIVASGDARVNNAKFKARFHCRPKMLSREEVLAATGHAVGGVCPFALIEPAPPVYLDCSLKRFPTVFPACGSDNSAIELSCEELFTLSKAAGWIDVCAGWQAENTA